MKLTVGKTLASAVDGAAFIVVRGTDAEVELTCGGLPMYDPRAGERPVGEPDAGLLGGSLIGKRYIDEAEDVELLCTKPGGGTIAINGTPLQLREAKPLPASD